MFSLLFFLNGIFVIKSISIRQITIDYVVLPMQVAICRKFMLMRIVVISGDILQK